MAEELVAKPKPELTGALTADRPLLQFVERHTSAIQKAGYSEIYGIDLASTTPLLRDVILQKFLRANANDVGKAMAQLTSTLEWRTSFKPLEAKNEVFSKIRFGGLGYVTSIIGKDGNTQVVTYNIYGAVKNNNATFEDIDGFIRWRVGLMELSIDALKLGDASTPIPDFGAGPDPYQGIQVHDYLSVSFLRQDPYVKAASSRTIELFKNHYPETLSRKFFVNVPTIMGWLFSAMKLVLSAETVKKFTVLTYGKDLAGELGSGVPAVYGGSGPDLETAETLKLE